MTIQSAVPFGLERLGTIMEPDPNNPDEAWGVLNPACCRNRAGELLLYPRKVRYRSPAPILVPDLAEERKGIVDNVVFPTAVDVRDNGRIDVYYGMADARIGVARMHVPEMLPAAQDAEGRTPQMQRDV